VSPSLASSSLLFLSFNAFGFLVSALTGSHLHLDLLGTGAFLPATLLPLLSLPVRSLPLSAVSSQLTLSLWSLRLSLFLFYRATILRHDARLADTMSTLPGMFGFWLLSALWGIFCSLPHTLSLHPLASAAASRKVAPPRTFAAAVSAAGFVVSLLGLALEVAADLQKWAFKVRGKLPPPAGGWGAPR
jgi:steroid 5-alpha reductase family enzyme